MSSQILLFIKLRSVSSLNPLKVNPGNIRGKGFGQLISNLKTFRVFELVFLFNTVIIITHPVKNFFRLYFMNSKASALSYGSVSGKKYDFILEERGDG